MDVQHDTPYVERPDFFNGQRLFAADLQYVDAFNREMRWLHNKSLHQPGVGSGYAVGGQKGDRVVTVGPGYALDAEGREIILTREQSLPIPPVAGEEDGKPSIFDLTVSYADELEETETREGVCLPRGVVRRQEEPVFCWVPLHCEEVIQSGKTTTRCLADAENRKAIQSGFKIVLARIAVKNCELAERVSIDHRRSARSCRQPCVYGRRQDLGKFNKQKPEEVAENLASILRENRILFGNTSMLKIRKSVNLNGMGILVLKGQIDTSSANFMTVPSYHVTLQRTAGGALKTGVPQLLFQWVQDQQPASFTVVLGFVPPDGKVDDEQVVSDISKHWELSWIGIEG